MQQPTVMCAGKTDAAATGIPSEGRRYLYHERGGVEKPGELLGDRGLCGQPDADGAFKRRIDEIFSESGEKFIFHDRVYSRIFHSLMNGRKSESLRRHPNYAAAVFLLSADGCLWERVKRHVADTGIYFDASVLAASRWNSTFYFMRQRMSITARSISACRSLQTVSWSRTGCCGWSSMHL